MSYDHFNDSSNILVSGCGGGYDIFCGIDLLFNLLDRNKRVVLGSYTFTDHRLVVKVGEKVHKYCYKIDSTTEFDEKKYIDELIESIELPTLEELEKMNMTKEQYIQQFVNSYSTEHSCYFPEYRLVQGLKKYGVDMTVYIFLDCGIKYLTEAYNRVIEIEKVDTVVLIDGGTDSLMTGSEKGLGTPYEDVSSIVAVYSTNVKNKFLYCLGYNIDKFHGVTDESFLQNTSDLIKHDYFIGCYMLNKKDKSTQKYIDIFLKSKPESSIVNSHIISAILGCYGNHKCEWLEHRLGDSVQYIHPLMGLYWIYSLEGVYKNLAYDVEKLKETTEGFDISVLLKTTNMEWD